jgi:hypothetical protein
MYTEVPFEDPKFSIEHTLYLFLTTHPIQKGKLRIVNVS